MKSKIQYGRLIYLIAILSACHESLVINPVTALDLTSFHQASQSVDANEQGILDRARKKIEQKEEQEQLETQVQFLQQQENLLKATRQAQLLSSQADQSTAQMMLQNMRMGGPLDSTETVSYDEQIKKIASKQDEYKDEYEGYGSLTEMIKHQGQMAEEVTAQIEQPKQIAAAKAKLAEALNQDVQKKKQEEESKKKEQEEKQKALANVNTTEILKNGKLSDSQVAQVIDEVSLEQDASESAPGAPKQQQEKKEDESYDQGFIGKYTKKLADKDKKDSGEEVEDKKEEAPVIPKKTMRARFEERVAVDQKDKEKAEEVVAKVQHAVNLKKKGVLERETEQIVQEQHDELALDLAIDGTADPSVTE